MLNKGDCLLAIGWLLPSFGLEAHEPVGAMASTVGSTGGNYSTGAATGTGRYGSILRYFVWPGKKDPG